MGALPGQEPRREDAELPAVTAEPSPSESGRRRGGGLGRSPPRQRRGAKRRERLKARALPHQLPAPGRDRNGDV